MFTSMLCFMFFVLLRTLLLFIFFFSSRRRHTRSLCDWSSDVCSSDLFCRHATDVFGGLLEVKSRFAHTRAPRGSRRKLRSEERRVGKSVDLGGRRII